MKKNTRRMIQRLFKIPCLLLAAGALKVEAANTIFTTTTTASGNWSTGANWGGTAPTGIQTGNQAVMNATASATLTLDVATTIGQVKNPAGGGRGFNINASGSVAMTMDDTGNTANNPDGNLDAFIGETSSGGVTFLPNIIIQNTDLDFGNTGSTSPTMTVGTLGTSTITAATPQNLFIMQNQATSTKSITINSSIGSSGQVITVQNAGTGGGASTMIINGVVGPNASIVQNSASSTLRLSAANIYTGPTTITLGTLALGLANAIPSGSAVSVTSTLNLAGFSDVIGGLSGAGTVNSTVGTPTLGIGGNNSSGIFSGNIENTAGTLSLTKTGTGAEVLNGGNTYSGTTTFSGGILTAGIADSPGSSGPFGSASSAGSIAFSGGTLQYSNAVNNQDYSSRFSTAASQPISIDVAGTAVIFATPLISSGGSLTLADSVGGGSLTLTAAETYSGNTTINGGSLVLGSGGSLANNSSINIGAGGTLDVSAQASPYTLGTGANFRASGAGAAATLVPAVGGVFNLGTQPVSLTWNGASSGTDSTHPSLTVSQGTLQFNGNPITVVVPGPALGVGVYTLVSASAAALSGAPSSVPLFAGNGLALGGTGAISVSGGNVILTVTLSAATVGTWTGAAGSPFNWSASGNWSGGVPQHAGDSALFGSAVTAVLLNTPETVGAVQFNNNSGAYTISGSATLTLDNKGGGAAVAVSTPGANAIQPPVSLNDSSENTTVTVASGDALAFSGSISSLNTNETLNLAVSGTNLLSGANSYGPLTGYVGTIFSGGGVLQLGNNNALGAGDLSVSASGTLQAATAGLNVVNNILLGTGLTLTANNNGYHLTLGGAISGGAALTAAGSGTLTLNGNNTYTGDTTINGGALSISSANNVASPNIVLNGADLLGNGTFTELNNIGIGLTTGAIGTNAFIDAASGQTFTVGGIIASAGNGGVNSLTINGVTASPGEVVLGGANTFTGPTVIANGTLDVANSLALQNSALNYSSGTLLFDGSITAATFAGLTGTKNINLTNLASGPVALTVGGNGANINYSNIVDVGLGGSLIKTGSGAMVLTNATYAGNTTVEGNGALTILGGTIGSLSTSTISTGNGGGAATLNISGGTVAANQVFNGTAANSTGCAINFTGSSTATFNNVQLGAGGDTSGPFTINTTGSVSLGNFIDYKDATAVSTGTGLIINNGPVTATSITIQDTTSAGNMTINGGSLTVGNSSSSGAFLVGNAASARGGWLSMTGGALTYLGTDGLLMDVNAGSASGAFFSGGTATLTGITLDDGGASTANSTLTVSNGATLYLGGLGLVDPDPAPLTNAVTFANGTVAAIAPWSSSVGIILVSNATIQAADSLGAAQGITLGGILTGYGGLIKTGAGTLSLTGANTYLGPTFINATTLSLGSSGSLTSTNIVIGHGTTLDVSSLATPLTLAGQTLTGGGAGATVNGPVIFGDGALAVNYTSGTPALAFGGPLTLGNNLVTVNVVGAPLAVGTYSLATYTASGSTGNFNGTPVITGAGLSGGDTGVVTNAAGVISLIVSLGVNPNPTNIVTALNGSSLTLSWPADHIGWRLQVQTNSLAAGLNPASSAWFTVPGSTTVNTNVATVDRTVGTVFYRLVYP